MNLLFIISLKKYRTLHNILVVLYAFTIISCQKDETFDNCYSDKLIIGNKECVVYTSLKSGVIISAPNQFNGREEYYLDINKDSFNDYQISVWEGNSPSNYYWFTYSIRPLNGNQVVVNSNSNILVEVLPLELGDTLYTNKQIIYNKPCDYCILKQTQIDPENHITFVGDWEHSIQKYVGLRIIKDNDTLLGWLSLQIVDDRSLKIYNYAIQRK